jgi:hypothetical protein
MLISNDPRNGNLLKQHTSLSLNDKKYYI